MRAQKKKRAVTRVKLKRSREYSGGCLGWGLEKWAATVQWL